MAVQISGTTVIDNTRNITNAVAGSFSSTVTAATPTASGHLTTKAYVDSAVTAAAPSGCIIYHAASTAPTGYLKANGAAVSRTTYAALFAAIGTVYGVGDGSTTFNLPDLRGEFIRSWDDARGVDTSRTFGSFQDQAYLSHNHGVTDPGHSHIVGSNNGTGGNYSGGGNSSNLGPYYNTSTSTQSTGITIQNNGGTETRPRNVALLACIKY